MVTLNSIITFVATDVLPEDVENNMDTPRNIWGCYEEYNYRRADICNPREKSWNIYEEECLENIKNESIYWRLENTDYMGKYVTVWTCVFLSLYKLHVLYIGTWEEIEYLCVNYLFIYWERNNIMFSALNDNRLGIKVSIYFRLKTLHYIVGTFMSGAFFFLSSRCHLHCFWFIRVGWQSRLDISFYSVI